MPVLEGAQGIKKSTAMRILCGGAEDFSDQIGDIHSKDSQGMIQGKWMIEGSRGSTNSRSRRGQHDQGFPRPPRGPDIVRHTDEITSTAHADACLSARSIHCSAAVMFEDATGARRFWPVGNVGASTLDGLAADRDPLWAEAYQAIHLIGRVLVDRRGTKSTSSRICRKTASTAATFGNRSSSDWLFAHRRLFTITHALTEGVRSGAVATGSAPQGAHVWYSHGAEMRAGDQMEWSMAARRGFITRKRKGE